MSSSDEPSLDQDQQEKLFRQLMEIYIEPSIKERQANGELEKPLTLDKAQIIFFPDNRDPEVRINSEVQAKLNAKLVPGVYKRNYEDVYYEEIEDITDIELTDHDDPDCAHVTLIRLRDRWVLGLDLIYNKAEAEKHLEVAKEFRDIADYALNNEMHHAFVENTFAALELTCRCFLMKVMGPAGAKISSHRRTKDLINIHRKLGNISDGPVDLLNTMIDKYRKVARYLDRDLGLEKNEAREMLETTDLAIAEAEADPSYVNSERDTPGILYLEE